MTILSLLVLFIYICVIVWKYGVPETISDSYYLTGKGPWFSGIMILTGLLLIPGAWKDCGGWTFIVPALTVIGIWMTGIFPNYKPEGLHRKLHLIGARVGGLISQVGLAVLGSPWLLLDWLLVGILFLGVARSCKKEELSDELDKVGFIFWMEMTCFINLYIGLLLR